MRLLQLFFFLSGIPALIYQLIWQRALIAIFGSNIESVTLVVSSFMLGLGVGSLVGGRLSSNPRATPLLLFGLFEIAIAIFGLASLNIIEFVGVQTVDLGPTQTFIASFLTVLIPTFLMGATLPLLLMHLVRRNGEVGDSIGLLYSINTLGSAFACLLGAVFIFGHFGMQGSVTIAACMNLVVGVGAVWLSRREPVSDTRKAAASEEQSPQAVHFDIADYINPKVAISIACFAGFVSLSYEVIWARAFFLALAGKAYAFPIVLGYFLVGIAIGAHLSRQHMNRFRRWVAQYRYLPFAVLLLVANVLSFMTIPVLNFFGVPIAVLLICASAAAFGAFLPLISELSIRADNSSGKQISYLYVANIVGSTAGTIITGLWLLDSFGLNEVAAILFSLGIVGVVQLLLFQPQQSVRTIGILSSLFLALPLAWFASPILHKNIYANLQLRNDHQEQLTFENISETRSGVVAISEDKIVYGTGVYDGRVRIDLLNDLNGVYRPIAVAAVHPEPKRVLVIGMSMGAWTQILANMPTVEHVQVVEINRGYVDLISQYPVVSSLLDNPKIDIAIDDGRRWLRRNPGEKFDIIVANTTFFWRSSASNLLSVEFLEQIKRHLSDDGVYFYNSTSSDRVQRTGAEVFDYAARFEHFVFASQKPLNFNKDHWMNQIRNWKIDGELLLDISTPEGKAKADELVGLFEKVGPLNPDNELEPALEFREEILKRTQHSEIITDDNMGAEWLIW